MNAWDDIQKYLSEGEAVEAIVFGEWCGYEEPQHEPVPKLKRGVLLSPEEANPMMEGWSFINGYGRARCYAAFAWTNRRVFWVAQYDGKTWLDSAPRNPAAIMPEMSGGG